MAVKNDKNEEDAGQAGVAQGPEVVVIGGGGASTGSASAPDVNLGTDTGENAAERAKVEERMRELGAARLDPVYNRPMSDFSPYEERLDDTSQELLLDNMRAGGVDVRAEKLQATVRGREAADARQARAEKVRDEVNKSNPLPDTETAQVDPATYRARAFARVQAEARTLQSSTTVPGGAFVVNGELVNARGDLINKQGKVLEKRSLGS